MAKFITRSIEEQLDLVICLRSSTTFLCLGSFWLNLKESHVVAQGLHPAITQSPLTLHSRSDHVSYLDLPSSSPPCGYLEGEDNEVFSSPAHRGHLPQQLHPLHPQHPPDWPIPLKMPLANAQHSVCLLPLEAMGPELYTGDPNPCSTNSVLGSSDPTGASCVSGEYGSPSLDDPDMRSIEGKTESSGEGVVPEPQDEVEACEGRSAGGSSTGESTGECEKGDITAVRDFGASGTAALGQLGEAINRGGQLRQ
ncbi:hypothetical protein PAMP_007602 [Pampus punctatissimus]